MKHATALLIAAVALAACGTDDRTVPRPTGQLSGTVDGRSFTMTGQRSTRADTIMVVTLINEPASCPENTPVDGQLRVDISIPDGVEPGHYNLRSSVIKVASTAIVVKDGRPSFSAVSIGDGDIWLDNVGDATAGALKAETAGTSIRGEFTASPCAKAR